MRMRAVGAALRTANVAAIYLAHGTFLGSDALGVLTELSRFAPALANSLRTWNKQILDAVAGDIGNFTRTYAEALETSLNDGFESLIPVHLFHWSSENHHLGRADGAVRLLHELAARKFPSGSRVLLWGHSHGGNVFALLTNLLSGDQDACRRFFELTDCFYRGPIMRRDYLPEWRTVRALICGGEPPLPGVALDFVTLGTPVRYGWDAGGYARLLHFVFHRAAEGVPEYQAIFPPTPDGVLFAVHGDIIQQIGVAGTNFSPPLWSWRAWKADRRLGRFLQPSLSAGTLLARLRLGIRIHADGETLLVDYGEHQGSIAQHLLGHAVYTRLEWQLFHAEEVARRFYAT